MQTLDTSKKLVNSQSSEPGKSITEIPRNIYSHFYKNRIGNEIKTETNGEIRLWCELYSTPNKTDEKVIVIFTEEFDGDSVKTKFALSTWYPADEERHECYEFEIIAEPQSRGWSHSTGNKFTEEMYYQTKSHTYDRPVPANHPLIKYMTRALAQMTILLTNPSIVRRSFIDNIPYPPR